VTRQLYEGLVLGQSDFFTRGSQTEADTSGSFRNQARRTRRTARLRHCASRKFGAAQGSKLFFQTNRKGRWACGPCLNLVNQIRCDAHPCASTLRTRESESQYRQGLIPARSGSPSFVAVVQPTDLRNGHDGPHFRGLNRSWLPCFLPQRKMRSRSVIVIEIRSESSS
jgi:hypothetical protein